MMDRQTILGNLPPFENLRITVNDEQSIDDIIIGILQAHKWYAVDYNRIYKYFDAPTAYDIAANIFSFLKQNVVYKVEGEENQSLKSPTAILALGKDEGGDCKSYALFIGGVIDALNRNEGAGIPFKYRFAYYDANKKNRMWHVFVVLYPDTEHEIWVDPVLNYLDERKKPYFYKDKKVKSMALQRVSGFSNGQVGDLGTLIHGVTGTGILGPLGSVFGSILGLLGGGGPNPNDWQGWDGLDVKYSNGALGNQAAHWILNDGDSVANEAANIRSWINAHGDSALSLIENSPEGQAGAGRLTDAFISKMQRGGIDINQYLGNTDGSGSGTGTGSGSGLHLPPPAEEKSDNTLLYLGIGAAVLYAVTKK